MPVEMSGNRGRSSRELQHKLFSSTGNLTSARAFQPETGKNDSFHEVGEAMTRENFWSGFVVGAAVGALAGVGGVLVARRGSASDMDSRVLRLEKSVNIGRPVQSVFAAWSNFERLPQWISFVRRVERYGTQTRWLVNIDGREFEWDAQITQVVPNESIGWKSLNGPKHTGRISFSPLGDQTIVHVLMNYAPPLGGFGSMLPIEQHLQQWIERGLREFKSTLEREAGKREFTSPGPGGEAARRPNSSPGDWEPLERTGTGDSGEPWESSTGPIRTPGKPAAPGRVSYTRPPKDK